VANLPYSIATPVVFSLLRREPPPADMVILVQREVGDRIRAAPGTDSYGPLSVLVQCVARTERVETVRKESFHPVPEVASTVIRVTPDPDLRRSAGDLGRLESLVFAAFSMRRKTLGNALGKAGVPADLVRAAGVDPSRRAETLSPAEFVVLAKALPSLAGTVADGESPAGPVDAAVDRGSG
jgi:16S rRNA (adenine1518-N6/adenine1519-N6)-dimethyltransferase